MPCPDPEAPVGPYKADYVLYPDTPLLIPGKPFDSIGFNQWRAKSVIIGVWNVSTVTISHADNSTIRFNPQMAHAPWLSYGKQIVYRGPFQDVVMIGPQWHGCTDPNYYTRDRRFVDIDVRPMKVLWLLLKSPGPYKFVGTNGVPTWEHPMLPPPRHARLTERRE